MRKIEYFEDEGRLCRRRREVGGEQCKECEYCVARTEFKKKADKTHKFIFCTFQG